MSGRRPDRAVVLVLAVVAYVPLWWSAPGKVAADTKSYLYLDPDRLLARAPYLWDHHTAFGTVTHQTIGYLWPMGPWFWLFEHLGAPDWVAQRLWLGTVLFAAGTGVLYLTRTLDGCRCWAPSTRLVAALAYCLSPYVLDYSARLSVILLPWAALPWLIALTVRAARRGGWRAPAAFALVVATVGGVNATALLLAGLGPLVWLVHLVVVERTVTARRAVSAAIRIGVLCAAVSAWWIAALWAQGRYGIPILRYTETYRTVADAATAPEVLRGLGYWFFYGSDKLGPWIEAAPLYTNPLLVTVGYALVAAALLAAATVAWAHRRTAVALVVVGLVVAVGAHPYEGPTVYGRLWKTFQATTTGSALRSTPRAVPLVALGLALLLAAGVAAVRERLPARPAPAARPWLPAAVAVVVVLANQLPLLSGRMYGDNLQRPEAIPAYWQEAADALSAAGPDTRVLEVPGTDFASYRWGNTVDPVTTGLTDRDVVARELVPFGSPPSADLLAALDRRFQEGVYEPEALAVVARLASVGTVAVRTDLQYERFRTPRPRRLWAELTATPGLGAPARFGAGEPNRAIDRLPLIDEVELGLAAGAADPPPVALFPVAGAAPELHAAAAGGAVVYSGDGEGLVDAAAAGLLDGSSVVLASGALAGRPDLLDAVLAATPPATLVVTDTNRRAARRWGTVRDNLGYTEVADEEPLVDDPTDNRLVLYPDTADDDSYRSVATLDGAGIAAVSATAYGNPVSYTPEDRPANALDGDPLTAWRVGAFDDVRGERLELRFETPVTTDRLTVLQPVTGSRNRWITEARVRTDGHDPLTVVLDDTSRTEPGQIVPLDGERTFTELSVEVVATNVVPRPRSGGLSGVGLAEVDVAGRRVDEVVRVPTDLLAAAGARSADHPLRIVATRWRVDPAEPVRADPETHLARRFTLPAERTFAVTGTARVSAAAPAPVVADAVALWGDPGVTGPGVDHADANRSLPGSLRAGPWAALDGDEATAWTTPFVFVVGSEATIGLTDAITVDHLDLVVVDDGRHSRPSELTITADDGTSVVVPVPAPAAPARSVTAPGTSAERAGEQAVHDIRVDLPTPVRGRAFTVAVTAISAVEVTDYYSETPVPAPVAIAEWGLPGVVRPGRADGAPLPGDCRDDLVVVDGEPVAVRVTGTVGDGLDRRRLAVAPCGGGLVLGPGDHEVRTSLGRETGFDVDRLVLAAGPAASAPAPPALTVDGQGPVAMDATVDPAPSPFWVVLGQSHNAGWRLDVDGVDQGEPVAVNGYANGWLITPSPGAPMALRLEWVPQRWVWRGLGISAAGAVVALALLAWPRRRTDSDACAPTREGRRRWSLPVVVALTVVGFGVVGGALAGLGAGAALALVRLRPATRRPLALVAPVAMGLAAVWVGALAVRYRLTADFAWPRYFDAVHSLGWLAVAVAAVLAHVPGALPLSTATSPGGDRDGGPDRAAPPAAAP